VSVLVAQLGARRHYAVARALHRSGLLDRLVTDMCGEQPIWRYLDRIVPKAMLPRPLERLLARRVAGVPPARIATLPSFAFSPAHRRRRGEELTDYWARRNRAFCRDVVRRGFHQTGAVYAFNGAALEIFEAAKARGLATLLDQTSAPWRWNKGILLDEALRWPDWEDRPSEVDVSGALAEREEREWELADAVICGSAFAATAVAETGGGRHCTVVPYAHRLAIPPASVARSVAPDRALRVLFAGTLQLRKGVQYLLEAARLLKGERVEIRLVGPSLLSAHATRLLEREVEVEVAGPASRPEMERHYAWADALLLPTLSEGSANVVYEAMAAGLAVVTTPNAGSIIRDGHDGLIVPARDPNAIADAIHRLAADRRLCRTLGREAQLSTAQNSFDRYADHLAAAYRSAAGPAWALCA